MAATKGTSKMAAKGTSKMANPERWLPLGVGTWQAGEKQLKVLTRANKSHREAAQEHQVPTNYVQPQ